MALISLYIAQDGFQYPSGSGWLATFGELFDGGPAPDIDNTVTVNGCLLLEGDLISHGNVLVTNLGLVIPVPDKDLTKSYFSLHTGSYITANGGSRTITSTIGGIDVSGLINGEGMGFVSNRGPGCNSTLLDSSGNDIPGYGATHAGTGYVSSDPSVIFPPPNLRYGHYETPMSLGSGSGYYHSSGDIKGEESSGGGGIRLVAKSGIIDVNGTINMNGFDGTHAGGGAGGSIWLHGWEIHGSGSMLSEGGETRLDATAGGGGGGYISLWHQHSIFYDGMISVLGRDGGSDGKYYEVQTEPVLEEPFTGSILNTKWWDYSGAVILNNDLTFSSPDGSYSTSWVESNFRVSGKEIIATVDYAPLGADSSVYNAAFLLYADEENWVGLARKHTGLFGVSCADGLKSASGIVCDDTNLSFRILKNDGTFSFQYYDTTSTPQTIYTDIRPELANKNFKIKIHLEKIGPKGSDLQTDYLRLTPLDVSRQFYETNGTPLNASAVAVNTIYGTSQYYGLDFYSDENQIKWDSTGLTAFMTPFSMMIIEHFILTEIDIARGNITLSYFPFPEDVALNVVHGTPQNLGADFNVVLDRLEWRGRNLDDLLSVGDELRVVYYYDPWNVTTFSEVVEYGDVVRTVYQWEQQTEPDDVSSVFDYVRIHEGVISGAETNEPVLYVDPDYGSDTSSGRQLEPMKNLFVATAWAKRGSTVVLYDGTHNSTYVTRKDLTIRGAEGVKPTITSLFSQDTTGSDWENCALSFYGCQGIVENVAVRDSTYGIKVENGAFDISRCIISDASVGLTCLKCDPTITRNRIYNVTRGMDFTAALSPFIYSNVIFDAYVAVAASQVPDMTMASNTFDNNQIHVALDTSSGAIISNNSLTWGARSIVASADSWVESYYNNFYPTPSGMIYNRPPDASGNNIFGNPLYYNRLGAHDYHINLGSANIGVGSLTYDNYQYDYDGTDRRNLDIGAYIHFLDTTHTGDIYVSSHGDDFWNVGSIYKPFRTLDRAMETSDSTIIIDGGHYDTFYLALSAKHVDLNQLFIHLGPEQLFVSFLTVSQEDIDNGYIPLPTFVEADEVEQVVLNILGGTAQIYDEDYTVKYSNLYWAGYALESFLGAGDIFRIIFKGTLQRKALNTFILHAHYTDFSTEKAVYVAPSGSDSTIIGGDGTNSGGAGTRNLPYRTIDMALSQSNPGDSIVAMAGEYPVFDSIGGRVLVPGQDQTAIQSLLYKEYYEDYFAPLNFSAYGWTINDSTPWTYDFTGNSSVINGGGFLSLTYDGSNTAIAESVFNFTENFEVSANFRNAIDPVKMFVTSQDSTAYFSYNGFGYSAGVVVNGKDYVCSGDLNVGDSTSVQNFITEYISVGANYIRDKYAPLSYIPEPDCTNIALNIVGGVAQNIGEDFYLQDSKVKWDGMGLDGELEAGDVLRVIYMDRVLSDSIKASISLANQLITIKVFDQNWRVVNTRNISDTTAEWKVSFLMDEAVDLNHDCIYGKGFVSNFLLMADGIDTDVAKSLEIKTDKRNLIFYEERS